MSTTLTQLTWDNLDEWIASIPKDENGHFKMPAKVGTIGHFIERSEQLAKLRHAKVQKWVDETILSENKSDEDKLIAEVGELFDPELAERLLNNHEIKENMQVLLGNLVKSAKLLKSQGFDPFHFVHFMTDDSVAFLKSKDDDRTIEITVNHPFESKNDITLHELRQNIPEGKSINLEKAELEHDPLLRAAKGLESLDVAEAEKEFAITAQNMLRNKELKESGLDQVLDSPLNNPDMTPEQLEAWRLKRIAKAANIVTEMDAHLEAGGRVAVDDKTLMNCQADLNQLIPFKYNWAWSLYLTSCSAHWMPMELEVGSCRNEYLSAPTFFKKLMARMWLTHLSRKQLFPESVLLNIYRLGTNPECRQYWLRQAQEFAGINHTWMEINDALNVKDNLIGEDTIVVALRNDDDTFKHRHRLVKKHAAILHNYTSTTDTVEELAEFLKAFIVLYTHTNLMMPLVSHYQVITATEFNEICQPVAGLLQKMNQDTMSQFEFARTFIAGVLAENQAINTDAWREDLEKALNDLIDCELDLVSTITAGENDYFDVSYFCNHYKDEVMSLTNPSHVRHRPTGDYSRGQEFVSILSTLTPVIDHSAGLGSISW